MTLKGFIVSTPSVVAIGTVVFYFILLPWAISTPFFLVKLNRRSDLGTFAVRLQVLNSWAPSPLCFFCSVLLYAYLAIAGLSYMNLHQCGVSCQLCFLSCLRGWPSSHKNCISSHCLPFAAPSSRGASRVMARFTLSLHSWLPVCAFLTTPLTLWTLVYSCFH